MDTPIQPPRFCLQPTAANSLGARLVSGAVRVLVVRDGDGGPSPGPRLFEIHRALEPAGVCFWQCRRGELVALLTLARRYGFDAEPPSLFWQDERSDWVVALRRGPGPMPVGLPAVLLERGDAATAAWSRALALAVAATGGADDDGPMWVVEPDAPDTAVAEAALGLRHSWLGRLVAANDDGETCVWMRRLADTGARSASAVPHVLGPDVPRAAPGAIADLFPEARQPVPRKARKRRASADGAPELPIEAR
jgi:hypothetical protein